MNGLSFIRTKCNISRTELADFLGVTKQSIILWENGRKPLPLKRKEQLSSFFGLDPHYFGEISTTEQKELLNKSMYIRTINGKQVLSYIPGKESKSDIQYTVKIEDNYLQSFDENYIAARKRKKRTLQEISDHIGGDLTSKEVFDTIDAAATIHKGCSMYDFATAFMDEIQKQERYLKVPLRYELFGIFYAILLSYGSNEDLIREKIDNLCSGNPFVYPEKHFIECLSDFMSKHWKTRSQIIKDQKNNTIIKSSSEANSKVLNLVSLNQIPINRLGV